MDEANNAEWRAVLKILWLGVGFMNNLTEPGVQLTQLENELPKLMTQNELLAPEFQAIIYDEITQQMKCFQSFHDDLSRVLQQYSLLAIGGKQNDCTKSRG